MELVFSAVKDLHEKHKAKEYYSNNICKRIDSTVDGRVAQSSKWEIHYARIRGNEMIFYDNENATSASSQINLSDAVLMFPDTSGQGMQITSPLFHSGVDEQITEFSINTAGSNKISFTIKMNGNTKNCLLSWLAAIRLSVFMNTLIHSYYTQCLQQSIRIANNSSGCEGYLQIRFAGTTQWQKYYCVLDPFNIQMLIFAEKKCHDQFCKKSKFSTASQPKLGKIQKYASKYASLRLNNPSSVYAIYPEKPELIKVSSIFKMERATLMIGNNVQPCFLGNKADFMPNYIIFMAESTELMLLWINSLSSMFKLKQPVEIQHAVAKIKSDLDIPISVSDIKDSRFLYGEQHSLFNDLVRLCLTKKEGKSVPNEKVRQKAVDSTSESDTSTEESDTSTEEESTDESLQNLRLKNLSPKRKQSASSTSLDQIHKHSKANDQNGKEENEKPVVQRRPVNRKSFIQNHGVLEQDNKSISSRPRAKTASLNRQSFIPNQMDDYNDDDDAVSVIVQERRALEQVREDLKKERELIQEQMETLRIMRQSATSVALDARSSVSVHPYYAGSYFMPPHQSVDPRFGPMNSMHQQMYPTTMNPMNHYLPSQVHNSMQPMSSASYMAPAPHTTSQPPYNLMQQHGGYYSSPPPQMAPHPQEMWPPTQINVRQRNISPTPSESISVAGDLYIQPNNLSVPNIGSGDEQPAGLINVIAQHTKSRSASYNSRLGVMQPKRDAGETSNSIRTPPRQFKTSASTVDFATNRRSLYRGSNMSDAYYTDKQF